MGGFGSRFVESVFDVSVARLHYWDKKRIVQPSVRPAAGRGSRKLYSFRDLVAIRTVCELRAQGISLQRIRRCIEFLRELFPDQEHHLCELAFVTDGETIFLRTDDSAIDLDVLRRQFVWSMPVGEWAREVHEKLVQRTTPEEAVVAVRSRTFAYRAEQDPEDGWWVASVPELPGCGTQARNREELPDMMEDAICCWLDAQEDVRGDAQEEEHATTG